MSWLASIGSGQVKSEHLLPNGFDGGHALIGRFGEPKKHIFGVLIGVQSGFAADGFVEAKHTTRYGF